MKKKDITAEEYGALKKALGYFYEQLVSNKDPKLHPLYLIEEDEAKAPKRTQAGVLVALADCLEWTSEAPPAAVAKWDKELGEIGAPTLSELRLKNFKQFNRLIERGKINNLKEYYLMKTYVDNPTLHNGALLPKILKMLNEFETAFIKRQGNEDELS
ncbi:hypothetical protein ACFOLJ_23590 [Rugamonas sp. CCM 8940]|uniref:hypothetical protein n=1 Tax=Rugamonas sp. CCM 8940 TaxID=2765359 RepID=UPI0018F77533|nr:hypothetical protein [Rugamonas sp. CCM 8940]MBJ7311996.1 hypothetical protein [Rugamonas sp. CCM 8940]